jgi:hypothetical protein
MDELTYIRQTRLCDEVQEELNHIEWSNGIFKLFRGVNGADHVVITGCSHHHQQEVIDLLHWIANKNSDSFGIIHIIDTDKINMDEKYGVKVWRLIKDEVIEFTDSILSTEVNKIFNICK